MNCENCKLCEVCYLQPKISELAQIVADKPFNKWPPMSTERKIKQGHEIKIAISGIVASNCQRYI